MENTKGWILDQPDLRDFDADEITDKLADPVVPMMSDDAAAVDIRKYCSPIENQGRLGSCVAQSVAGLAEYLERMTHGRHIDVSRLFLYYIAREMDGISGDKGSRIRTCMKGLRIFGSPPEHHWPYVTADFDKEPSAFAFGYGQALQATAYYRLDQPGRSRSDLLKLTKRFVAMMRPVAFGFSTFRDERDTGFFPFPKIGERPRGGHAVMCVGYDDNKDIHGRRGALLIRNSWGEGWGEGGYGWLPYDYVRYWLAHDFWILIKRESVIE